MANRQLPSPEELRQLLRYEPETGELIWLERPESAFKSKRAQAISNTHRCGKTAFTTVTDTGYKMAYVDGVSLYAHRVIWAITTGSWPENDVDHINGDRTDNRLVNLRAATRAQNLRNTAKRADNSSGHKGVHWGKARRRWIAEIMCDGKRRQLGRFVNIEDAVSAYDQAAKELFGEFVRSA
jgi:hypothetical protein